MLISYNWLKSYVKDIPKEDELTKIITFSLCEIESVEKKENGDTVYDLKILPDRAHDLLCHKGVAFEIAGLLGLSFQDRDFKLPENILKTHLSINIETDKCNRYMGRIVRGINIAPSPKWMKDYLESVGQRSINNIVDATNIVMFELGQPIHAFDLNKLNSENLVVRNAKEGETLVLVGSEKLEAKLKEADMMITDGDKSLAIAGVKGGLDSGITDNTKDILIEVANFDGVSVRKTSRRLSIFTDASKRYENGISLTVCDNAMDEITALIYEMCSSASFEEVVDVYKNIYEPKSLSFDKEYISKILGVDISNDDISKILNNYHYEFSIDGNIFTMKIPANRLDITGPHDMAEDIGRSYGYENIIPLLPNIKSNLKDSDIWTKINLAKFKLISDGYKEVMNYSFTNKGEVEILASASDKNFLRTNLTDGLKKSYELNKLNLPLLGLTEIKIFEVGTIFLKDKEEIHVAYGDKKGITEMSLEEFIINKVPQEIYSEGTNISLLGNFSARPRFTAQGSQNEFSATLLNSQANSFKMWSLYPFISRDIAVWVPETLDKEKLKNLLIENGTNLLIREPYLFDSFSREGRTSYAYRLVFQSYDKTLSDDEINLIMEKINAKISELGWQVR